MINTKNDKKSIFKALFIPLFIIMFLQSILFYMVAVYGGIEETTNQNAADILKERLQNRKNEIETMFGENWSNLSGAETKLNDLYSSYIDENGNMPLTKSSETQIDFLGGSTDILVSTLRNNSVNGIFLILNDETAKTDFQKGDTQEKIGVCLRDLDQSSNYTNTEDLLVERAPSSVISKLASPLDSWWEARYSFTSEEEGAYYYKPLNAAWDNPDASGENLAYFQNAHRISKTDQYVVSYSIPLIDENGYPYGVLGVELTTSYLASLLPSTELGEDDKSCYILALMDSKTGICTPILGKGAMYNRCFAGDEKISTDDKEKTGGFKVKGRENSILYGEVLPLEIYSNNNPFEDTELVLMAFADKKELFSYSTNIKERLAGISFVSLLIGLGGLFIVSRRFAKPITNLAKKVQTLPPQDGFTLGRLGIDEIDQLVESIENLNKKASRDIARTEFFSRMSHDMRTPMNAIISFSSPELLENTTEEKKQEYLEKIHSSGEFLLGLINEVLDMTKIESDNINLQVSPVKTNRMLTVILSMVDKLAQEKNIDFVKDISIEETLVMVDEQHLNQILMNLLSNAVKFTPEGGRVTFKINAKSEVFLDENIIVHAEVEDTGIGISEEFMEHLYEPFEQENYGKEGTGLGLPIAKKLIELMGGNIYCTSEKNKGTKFTVDFPLRKCTSQEVAKISAPLTKLEKEKFKKDEISVFRNKRILVCEDHELNTQIIVKLLERVGIEVETAPDGKVGVETFQSAKEGYFDAILLDIRMPIMDGLETARTIRAMEREDSSTIPIIAMTANAFSEDVAASKAAGMNEHLSKPINPKQLYETLHNYIK